MEEVVTCLGHVPPSDPKYLFALIEKANLEWSLLNRPIDGFATSQQVVAIDPRVSEVQSRLISYYAMTLQRAPLLKTIRSAIAARSEPPEAYSYLMLADSLSFANGADLNSRWLTSAPDEIRFKIGLAVHTAGNIFQNADAAAAPNIAELEQEAEQQLKWFLDSAPHDAVLLTYLMHRAYQAGNAQRVGELLQSVDDSGAEDHMVWVYRGWYHIQMKELPEAEAALMEALRLHPLSALAHHEFASLLRLQQRPEQQVAEHQNLTRIGQTIRAQLLLRPNVREIPQEMFSAIFQYASDCHDKQIADALWRRIGPSARSTFTQPDKSPGPPSDNSERSK